jgi:hypothetical protein
MGLAETKVRLKLGSLTGADIAVMNIVNGWFQ